MKKNARSKKVDSRANAVRKQLDSMIAELQNAKKVVATNPNKAYSVMAKMLNKEMIKQLKINRALTEKLCKAIGQAMEATQGALDTKGISPELTKELNTNLSNLIEVASENGCP